MAKDPVCNTTFDKEIAAAKSEYRGTIYYFCSFSCAEAFDAEPLKYVHKPNEHSEGHSC
jgi:Cu+-exporting ATPase